MQLFSNLTERAGQRRGEMSTDDIPKDQRVGEYDWAIEHGRVTLDQLIDVRHKMSRDHNDDEASRLVHARYGPNLTDAYEREHGCIEDAYFCKQIHGGAVLTERRSGCRPGEHHLRIHMRYPPKAVVGVTPEFEEALWRCTALSKKATQLLRTENSRMLHKLMYSLIVYLLSVLDTMANEPEEMRTLRIDQALKRAKQDLKAAEDQYLASARWGAQFAYSKGLLYGLGYLAVLAGGLVGTVKLLNDGRTDFEALDHFLICLFAGGLGAIASVMYRMGSGQLRPDHNTEHGALTLLAGFRPLVGGVFASAIYVLIWGRFLTLAPPDAGQTMYFVAGISFLSGFSERYAQATLSGAAQGSLARSRRDRKDPKEQTEYGRAGRIEGEPTPAAT
ncbi:MAG TPA: hypothetical protein VHL54_08330 [Actinomycetota bacterium]|nr:hypothetical protein [Actinomycetota bacterium]